MNGVQQRKAADGYEPENVKPTLVQDRQRLFPHENRAFR